MLAAAKIRSQLVMSDWKCQMATALLTFADMYVKSIFASDLPNASLLIFLFGSVNFMGNAGSMAIQQQLNLNLLLKHRCRDPNNISSSHSLFLFLSLEV